MDWINTGDINPQQGTTFYRDPAFDAQGDFSAEVIEVINETAVGGDEKRLLLRQGMFFLSRENFASALATVGARLDGNEITRGDIEDGDRFEIRSEEGLRELFVAGHAYGGLQGPDLESLVQIGKDEPYDQDRKFPGERSFFRAGTSIWQILSAEMDAFPLPEGMPRARPYKVDEPEDDGLSM